MQETPFWANSLTIKQDDSFIRPRRFADRVFDAVQRGEMNLSEFVFWMQAVQVESYDEGYRDCHNSSCG